MNPLMFRLEEEGRELVPFPTPEGLVFMDRGEKIGVLRISQQIRPPFVRIKVRFDYQGSGILKYFGKTIIAPPPRTGVRGKRHPLTAEFMELMLPPPLNFFAFPLLVKKYEFMNPERWLPF